MFIIDLGDGRVKLVAKAESPVVDIRTVKKYHEAITSKANIRRFKSE